jgi:hypothetical protein
MITTEKTEYLISFAEWNKYHQDDLVWRDFPGSYKKMEDAIQAVRTIRDWEKSLQFYYDTDNFCDNPYVFRIYKRVTTVQTEEVSSTVDDAIAEYKREQDRLDAAVESGLYD